MRARDKTSERLQAYYDGELRGLARWRFERRLERDPALQGELFALEETGRLLRLVDSEAAAPDLCEAIRLRLPALEVQRAELGRGCCRAAIPAPDSLSVGRRGGGDRGTGIGDRSRMGRSFRSGIGALDRFPG